MPSAGADNPAGPGRVNEEASRAEARADAEREFARRQDWAANQRSRPDEAAWPSASKRDDRVQPIEVIRTRSFSFGQLLTMVVGAAFIALGVSAVIETGVDTPLDQPVQDVLGYAHPPLLGIFEIGVGGLLVLLSLRPGGRWLVAALGLVLVYAGVLVLGEVDWAVEKLGAESAYGCIPIVAGVTAIVSALLTPRRHQRMTGVPTIAATT